MAANDMNDYFIYDNRLASFNGPQTVAKRRTSSAAHSRAPKALSWPHKSIKPADVSKAARGTPPPLFPTHKHLCI